MSDPLEDGISSVQLLASLGGDLTTVNSARVSFGHRHTELTIEDENLIDYLGKNDHTSPFRHTIFQLYVKAPEFVARQWYKHVVGGAYAFVDTAWNEFSQRWNEVPLEFYTPPNSPRFKASATKAAKEYMLLLKDGVSREQARSVLPISVYTKFYWTASLQAVHHFCALRKDKRAQVEIQKYAQAIEELCKPIATLSWAALSKENGPRTPLLVTENNAQRQAEVAAKVLTRFTRTFEELARK